MGKRSNFERIERDFYPTPSEAIYPLLKWLPANSRFIEPCAGNGAMMDYLVRMGHVCTDAFDIEPQREDIKQFNALDYSCENRDFFITNPPWNRNILHPLIEHLSKQKPTWLLFDADWMHTRQSTPYLNRLYAIISVGRIKWIPNSTMSGKDNCCWYLFDKEKAEDRKPVFIGRT